MTEPDLQAIRRARRQIMLTKAPSQLLLRANGHKSWWLRVAFEPVAEVNGADYFRLVGVYVPPVTVAQLVADIRETML